MVISQFQSVLRVVVSDALQQSSDAAVWFVSAAVFGVCQLPCAEEHTPEGASRGCVLAWNLPRVSHVPHSQRSYPQKRHVGDIWQGSVNCLIV